MKDVHTDAPGADNDGSRPFPEAAPPRRPISEGKVLHNKREEDWRNLAAN